MHILPRKPGDFGSSPDNIYKEIERYREPRQPQVMAEEAAVYRKLFE